MSFLQVNDAAPDFEVPGLVAGVRKRFRLSDGRGKRNFVLAFHPFNWEPVSESQMVRYQVERGKFARYDAEVVAISVDSIMNTTAWEREIGPLDFALISDFWPHGEVCRKYDVLQEVGLNAGAAQRAIFVVDKAGQITFRKVYDVSEAPAVDDALAALSRL